MSHRAGSACGACVVSEATWRLSAPVTRQPSVALRQEANLQTHRKVTREEVKSVEQFVVRLANRAGLHARPAASFVQVAAAYASQIHVRNRTRDVGPVDAKSILGVLSLGAEQGHELEIQIDGPDAAQAAAALRELLEQRLPAEDR